MKLCNDTVTVYNARLDREKDSTVYIPTIIRGVSWYGGTKVSVDSNGLKAANRYAVRIPKNADAGGKSYTEVGAYRNAEDVSRLFTLNEGDFIVKGAFAETLETLPKFNVASFVIIAVSDNRRAPNAPHWKVMGT